MENEIMYIKLDDIIPNRFQPREVFDEDSLNKLADSIRQHGVIEPILVRPVSNKYEIIAGERRYKASILAGLTKIPAMVRKLDDKESSIIAFIENEHRSDVSAIEEARTMDRILKNNNMTQEELAKELGINQSTIANKIRLLNLPLEVQEAVMQNEISERHARSLLSVKDELKQKELLNKIKEKRMSVRELDSEIKSMNDNMNNNQNMDMNQMYGNFNNDVSSNPTSEGSLDTSDIMSYLNNYDNNQSSPTIPQEPTPPVPETTNNDYMSFLNNFDSKPVANEEPQHDMETGNDNSSMEFNNPTPESEPIVAPEPTSDNGFMDYLNTNSLPNEEPQIDNMNSGLNNFIPEEPTNNSEDVGFMQFLNDYDNNNPLPSEEPQQDMETGNDNSPMDFNNSIPESEPTVTPEPTNNNGFMDYLSNYNNENNNPLPPRESQTDINNMSFIPEANNSSLSEEPMMNKFESTNDNNFMNNNPLPSEEPTTSVDMNNQFEFNTPLSTMEPTIPTSEPMTPNMTSSASNENIMINNVVPPVTSDFNQYVENTANYVDVSKQEKINSVDEIISKLGAVIQEIKEKSIYKVDTEEINYDDLYQITIKIDKREN